MESSCVGDGSHGQVIIEETDGSSNGPKRVRPLCPCSWKLFGLEVEEELLLWPLTPGQKGSRLENWHTEQREAQLNQVLKVQTWRQVRGPAGAVVCETRELGIKWPQWHTLLFEGEVKIDMRYVCPKDVKKMLLRQARSTGRGGQQSTSTKN